MTCAEFSRDLIARLLIDLAPTGLTPTIGIFDATTREWVISEGGELPDDLVVCGSGFQGFVVTVGGPNGGGSTSAGESGALDPVTVVDHVQDWAIEELWHGWPEVVDESGGYLGLLRPAASDGDVVWHGAGMTVPVGRLASVRIGP